MKASCLQPESNQRSSRRRWRVVALPAAGTVALAACGASASGATSTPTPRTSVSAAPNMSAAAAPAAAPAPAAAAAPAPAAAGAGAGAGAGAAVPASTAAVGIVNFAFTPAALTVKAGTTVVWTNKDAIGHTVSFATGGINSAVLNQNDKFSHTFTTPGTYDYICSIHPFMHGSVTVTA